ncbi:hypothetical protein [Aliikangiella maris]|uniref:ATPase n=2 Tax=Aliikangiella maris TaxID=3162458 RepID=A0ABV2BY97_9GAMM
MSSKLTQLITTISFGLLLFFSTFSQADVVRSEDNYFEIQLETLVNAPIDQLDKTLLAIHSWWQADHTYSGESRNLYLDIKQQHCFCETLPDDGIVRHMQVVFYQRQKKLRLSGGLGPLQALAVNGVLEFSIKADTKTKSHLLVTYRVSGTGAKLTNWANPVNQVISAQVNALKQQAEK